MMKDDRFSEKEIEYITEALEIRQYKAGDILLRAGEIANACYHTLKGCVRQYYLIDGEEKTTFFYTEGQSIVSYSSATEKVPAKHYLSCVEDTTLAVMTTEKEEELYRKFPKFESLSRVDLEKQLGNYQEMLANYITTTPEERYLDLLENRPELLRRVPQYQLASYVGVKPESLSRIRKRITVYQ